MKSLIAVVFLLISLIIPVKHVSEPPKAPTTVAKKEKSILVNPVKAEVPVMPQQLIIPAINMDTKVLQVDLNAKNLVDVPANDVGWYVRGAKPGNPGNAVLQGHVRSFDMSPGIFSRLSELHSGDDIYTVDTTGIMQHFKVVANDLMDVAAFPVEKVYGSADTPNLNLITCAGSYDSQKGDFTQRTVIYSQLVKTEQATVASSR